MDREQTSKAQKDTTEKKGAKRERETKCMCGREDDEENPSD